MRIEEYKKLLEDMSEEEILELVEDLRINRQTVTQARIQAVRKKSKSKNAKAAVKSLSYEEKVDLAKKLGLPIPAPPTQTTEENTQTTEENKSEETQEGAQ